MSDEPSVEAIARTNRLVLVRLITRLSKKDEITQDINHVISSAKGSKGQGTYTPDTLAALEEFIEALEEH